ncbi:MAG: efflux RND transporter periplasmic adaptor subunit [Uliginosibacterium sp.]|nr:efflux RND transporter periplasmic adaptor subunit [Uliginosibacterium sp.]
MLLLSVTAMPGWADAPSLASASVRVEAGGGVHVAEAVVEAVHQSVISAQVSGRITALSVKAGDIVRKGQVLVRIDAQAATQQVTASQAQVEEAKAQLDVARKTLERQRQLFRQHYISQAAFDQAEAQFKVTEAGVRGSIAQAGAATTQTGFYSLAAPFDGVVAEVSSEQGDMAMPGKPLLTVFDPAAMRVVATLPQSRVAGSLWTRQRFASSFPPCPRRSASRLRAASRSCRRQMPRRIPCRFDSVCQVVWRVSCRECLPAPASACKAMAGVACWCRHKPWCGAVSWRRCMS